MKVILIDPLCSGLTNMSVFEIACGLNKHVVCRKSMLVAWFSLHSKTLQSWFLKLFIGYIIPTRYFLSMESMDNPVRAVEIDSIFFRGHFTLSVTGFHKLSVDSSANFFSVTGLTSTILI